MPRSRTVLSSIALALALSVGVLASMALGATTKSFTVSGSELGATSTLGVFAGTATGELSGSWLAAVEHTPLDAEATITGGSFTFDTAIGGSPAFVTGTFTGGTVVLASEDPGCGQQVYHVTGDLGSLSVVSGTGVASGGSGTFGPIVLTHHRTAFFGLCFTFRATVSGPVRLTY
ncbi:MAG: hypothetical protein ACRDF0_02410 [Candidatus Limnocylindria bacterium]